MATSDSLHIALDLHQLDPKAKEDRPYLISLLRRMGYTEVEIADVVSGARTLAEVDADRAESDGDNTVEDVHAARLIELEYGGASHLPEFEPVTGKIHPSKIVAEPVFEVVEEAPPEEVQFIEIEDEPEPEPELVEFIEEEVVVAGEDWDDWEPAHDESPEEPEGHRYGDFTLYRRGLDDGQHVYFFSRKDPHDAEPADLPPGYAVAESDETGMPYLVPEDDEGAATRVRPAPRQKGARAVDSGVTTVEADSPEEARRIAERRGLKVHKIVPVELEDD